MFSRMLTAAIIIILATGTAYGLYQYSAGKNGFENARFDFSRWRVSGSQGNRVTFSIEYSAENPSGNIIRLEDFDIVISFEDVNGTAFIRGFSLNPGQKIERTFQADMWMSPDQYIRFVQDSNVHISGNAHLRFLALEVPQEFEYDAPSSRIVFA